MADDRTTAPLDLPIGGMTCAACANRVERGLNKLEGVSATVNYATERASIRFDPAVVVPERLVEAVRATGYEAELPAAAPTAARSATSAEEERAAGADLALRRRVIIATLLALPVVVLSMVPALQFDNWQWVILQFATPVVFWAAWPFHRAAWINLRHGAATMDTLVSLGVLAAWGWSVVVMLVTAAGDADMRMHMEWVSRGEGTAHLYLEVAAAVTVFLLIGRWAEARAKRRSGAALRALMELGASEAAVLGGDGSERAIPVEQLTVGQRFVVRPGERVATDGVVESGASAIDTSLITGESVPREVGPGETVVGATINVGGRLVVRATRVGADTALAQITRMVVDAQAGKAPVQRLADRVSAIFVPAVLLVAAGTLAFWLLNGSGANMAFTAAVSVLIIACPCALGLATPTALLVGTGRGAQMGILITGPEVLESTRRIDTVVLDKTGTVTTGLQGVVDSAVATGADGDRLWAAVGAVEDASEHPIGRAIAAEARRRVGTLPEVEDFVGLAGRGVRGRVEGRLVEVARGRPDPGLDPGLAAVVAGAESRGVSAVVATVDGVPMLAAAIEDTIKPTSARAVGELRRLGLEPVLLTGDAEATARRVAAEVGIERVMAEVLPDEKAAAVARLQQEGRAVAMVGDGVNDAPALARADLGIAIGGGADAAMAASDLTVVSGDLRGVVDAVRLSRRTLGVIRGNLFWAFAYNAAAIPLAAAGLLNPLLAGAAMAASSVCVVLNSLRLRRVRSVRERPGAGAAEVARPG